MPYVFQALAALLEANPAGAIPPKHLSVLDLLLSHSVWETRGNVPGCTRLLSVMIPRAASHIVANDKLQVILGIFQELIKAKKLELWGLDILEAVTIAFES
jgi:exportin-2 (importin alpha re-exporter)